jgi:hypothetical protein
MSTVSSHLEVRPTRISGFDPNSLSREDPRYHVALLSQALGPVEEDTVVFVEISADDEDDMPQEGLARVVRVDLQFDLCYLEVFGETFHDMTKVVVTPSAERSENSAGHLLVLLAA